VIVEVLAVGTELLLGQIVNTNGSKLGARLADAGLDHFHQSVVGDNVERMAAAIALACSRADALIITGGLGPTQDDLTRDAMCLAAGVELEFDDGYAEELRIRWEARGRKMPESNLRQAQYPEGSDMIPNPKGSAPGLRMEIDGTWVFAVPGVPAEMLPLVDRHVIPFLNDAAGGESGVVVSRLIRSWGMSESKVGEVLADLFDESENPTLAFLASSGEIKVRVTAKARNEDQAYALIEPVAAEVKRRLGSRVFGVDEETVEHLLLTLLSERGWSIATAESATGGMLAARITSVPGASAAFKGSVVAYEEGVKSDLLGVSRATIAEHGVVSPEVAEAMAEGAARALGADVVVAVTGAAGPEPLGARPGTMVVAVRTPKEVRSRVLFMPGDRERRRRRCI
jgi:nicotinamide-nucleotide amidase